MPTGDPTTDASLLDHADATSTYREANGVELHVVAAGDPDDPLVVLLHGFPEFWYEWRAYVDPLVDAGYRVIVPDQRGYNVSEKPSGTRAYRTSELSADVASLITSEGRDAAHVVGHDWGAAVAWDLALRQPDRVNRLGIINVPHPVVFRNTLRSSLRQLRRSWYILFFQLPRLPEWVSRRNDYAAWVAATQGGARDGAFSAADMDQYRTAWDQPGAVTGMLNWYRAIRHTDAPPRQQVESPTLVIWGEQDQALIPEMAPASVDFCETGRLERFPDATHWIPHERPDELTELLLGHLES